MEFVNLIIDGKKLKNTCFLCFKAKEINTSIYQDFVIEDEYFTLTISLTNIMKRLFPAIEPLLGQACDECTSLLLKMFVLIHSNDMKKGLIEYIVNKSNHELDINLVTSKKQRKNIKINLNLSTNSVLEKSSSEKNHKQNLKKDKACNHCIMTFNTIKDLQKHIRAIHKNNHQAIVCDVCGKTCKTPNSLKAHLNSHTEKECPYCYKSLKTHSHYNVHVRNHNTNVPRQRIKSYYNCSNCSYRSVNKHSLEAHMNKMHLCIRPYVCQMCFKGFYKKSNLTEHILIHDKSKKHTCDICGDSFVTNKTLSDHLKLHVGEKCFECSICKEKFINSGRRLEHMKRKHMEKSECCNICSKKFGLKRSLNVHMKTIHFRNSDMSDALCWD